MRKSVMKSMVIGSLIVMIITFLVMTSVMIYSVNTTATNDLYSEIESSIDHVKPLTQMLLSFNTSKMYHMFDESMRQFSYFTKTNMILFDGNFNVTWTDTDLDVSVAKSVFSKVKSELGKSSEYKAAGLGDSIYGKKTVSVAERIKNDFNQEIGYIIVTREKPLLPQKYVGMFIELLFMELAALVFTSIFLFMFSKNITGPLRKINDAVKDFTAGNFDRRIEYKSHNEIGELAGNINDMAMSIQNFEKRRTDFISDVSHELRTPMTSISGFIEGIIDGTISNADAPKYLDVVLSETKRLSRLVSDLLSLSRIDDGRMVINKSTFDIVELARLIIIKFEKIITTKGIEVNFESDSESLEVFADKDSLTQVLTNLFHNAVKFAPDGGYVRISISENNNKCLICIVNNGHGIEPDKLDFIWERFYKTDYSRSSDRSGVGLGLYIVKRILDSHGEKINVTSEVNGETVFSFSLDLA